MSSCLCPTLSLIAPLLSLLSPVPRGLSGRLSSHGVVQHLTPHARWPRCVCTLISYEPALRAEATAFPENGVTRSLFRLLPPFPLLGLEPGAFSLPISSYTTGSRILLHPDFHPFYRCAVPTLTWGHQSCHHNCYTLPISSSTHHMPTLHPNSCSSIHSSERSSPSQSLEAVDSLFHMHPVFPI